MASVAVGKVGDLKLILGNVIPVGFLSLGEGTLLNRTEYAALWTWAQANARVISESAWQSELTANGSCGAFSTGNGSTTFRLPKIQTLMKAAAKSAASTFNKAVYNNKHYHGMGPMWNNNGKWGKLAYSTSSYPSGATGYYWNGKGGHSTYDTPPNDGSIITSLNMGDSDTAVPVPASVNMVLCIRYTEEYQETAVAISTAAAYAAVSNMTDVLNEAQASYLTASNLSTTGWQLYESGELEQWGTTEPGVSKGAIVFPIAFNEVPYTVNLTIVDPLNASKNVQARITKITDTMAEYVIEGELASDAYLMWYCHGKN